MIVPRNRKNIVVPCIVSIWLYSSGDSTLESGFVSCARMINASIPPSRKKTKDVTR